MTDFERLLANSITSSRPRTLKPLHCNVGGLDAGKRHPGLAAGLGPFPGLDFHDRGNERKEAVQLPLELIDGNTVIDVAQIKRLAGSNRKRHLPHKLSPLNDVSRTS